MVPFIKIRQANSSVGIDVFGLFDYHGARWFDVHQWRRVWKPLNDPEAHWDVVGFTLIKRMKTIISIIIMHRHCHCC